MINVLSADEQVILAITALIPSVMAVMNLATLPRTSLTRFLHQEHHVTMADLIQGINISTTGGTDHTPIMVPDISAGNIPTLIPTAAKADVLEGTPQALLPATAAAHANPQLIDAPIAPHAMIPTGIVALHPTLATSPVDATHATPWTGTSLTRATPTA